MFTFAASDLCCVSTSIICWWMMRFSLYPLSILPSIYQPTNLLLLFLPFALNTEENVLNFSHSIKKEKLCSWIIACPSMRQSKSDINLQLSGLFGYLSKLRSTLKALMMNSWAYFLSDQHDMRQGGDWQLSLTPLMQQSWIDMYV